MGDIEETFDVIKTSIRQALIKAVEEAKDDVINIVKNRTSKGKKESGQSFSPYSTRHKYRRKKEGLQTGTKDFRYSGSLFDSFQEIKRVETDEKIEIVIGFKGQSKRRSDQQSASNADVSVWLSDQENGSIIKLSDSERSKIIDKITEKFNVELQIND